MKLLLAARLPLYATYVVGEDTDHGAVRASAKQRSRSAFLQVFNSHSAPNGAQLQLVIYLQIGCSYGARFLKKYILE